MPNGYIWKFLLQISTLLPNSVIFQFSVRRFQWFAPAFHFDRNSQVGESTTNLFKNRHSNVSTLLDDSRNEMLIIVQQSVIVGSYIAVDLFKQLLIWGEGGRKVM